MRIGGLRTAAVVLRVVRVRMNVVRYRKAEVLRRGWGLEGDIVSLVDWLTEFGGESCEIESV